MFARRCNLMTRIWEVHSLVISHRWRWDLQLASCKLWVWDMTWTLKPRVPRHTACITNATVERPSLNLMFKFTMECKSVALVQVASFSWPGISPEKGRLTLSGSFLKSKGPYLFIFTLSKISSTKSVLNNDSFLGFGFGARTSVTLHHWFLQSLRSFVLSSGSGDTDWDRASHFGQWLESLSNHFYSKSLLFLEQITQNIDTLGLNLSYFSG